LVLPLKNAAEIEERQQLVSFFYERKELLFAVRKWLNEVGDMSRIASKAALNRINPREVVQLAKSLKAAQEIMALLGEASARASLQLTEGWHPSDEVIARIESEINEDAPVLVNKGAVIREGINEELDQLRKIAYSGKDYLLEIQKREIAKTGIPSLKIGFNNVFGYYLEVTNVHRDKVPTDWIRKQTLTGAERYITPELKQYEETILNAEEKIGNVEQAIWERFVLWLSSRVPELQKNALLLSRLDCLAGFAHVAIQNHYCKPEIHDNKLLELFDCRHPVIEKQLPPDESYIPNHIHLNDSDQRIIILTGPNMSGKSAILRQTALTVIMAQTGSYVPCKAAKIGIIDKIYTRVGASDNISLGESTFMVEMTETASILNNLSDRSLLILDEIGRGTSTYDGVSLAWSIAEYLQSHPAAPKTLFATHYHELNELEDKLDGIKNYHISIREQANKIVFLRKLEPGGSEHSFGIHVAQMAGIPNKVLLRASEILHSLESERASISGRETLKNTKPSEVFQLNMFQTEDPRIKKVREVLKNTDINAISPIDALLKLQELKNQLNQNE
ncbi:MAG: DNA mismatch repair protein MutS, partial [Bacteroidetes bacterium]|nr:DNA mismatch repair protein MutS [Bacteroidota bacterium]